MAAETDNQEHRQVKFTFQGVQYDLPALGELDMDEWMLVYKYAKVTISDTVPQEDPADEKARLEKLNQPGVMLSLFHIAYRRANPKKTDAAIEAIVGKINYLDTLAEIGEQIPDEDEENPTSATEPETSLSESLDSSKPSLSLASLPSSETPESPPAPIGISG